MDDLHGLARALRLLLAAVDDQVERLQRAQKPAPEILVVVGVVDHAGRNERVRDLEQDGPPPSIGTRGELPTRRITLSGAK